MSNTTQGEMPYFEKKECFQKMHYKAGNQKKQEGYGQNRTGKIETLGQKKSKWQFSKAQNYHYKSTRSEKSNCPQGLQEPKSAQLGPVFQSMLKVPCAVSDGSTTKQTHVIKKEINGGGGN